MKMLIISLLTCLTLLNFGFASPLAKRRGVYYLDCTRTGQAALQNFCTSPPYSYMCVPGSGVLMVARGSTVCDRNCDCVLAPAPRPDGDCYITPFIITPLCGIKHEEATAKNMTLVGATTKKASTTSDVDFDKDIAKDMTKISVTRDEAVAPNMILLNATTNMTALISDTVTAPADKVNTLISNRSDIGKRHDYALDCTKEGSSFQKYCTESPRSYSCTETGRVTFSQSNTICNNDCVCHSVGPPCYISPWSVLPLCGISKEEADAGNMTKISATYAPEATTRSLASISIVDEAETPAGDHTQSIDQGITDLSPTSDLEKRHDYALICTGSGNKAWQSYCTKSPRKYFCNWLGQVKSQKDSATCNMECVCVDVGASNPCYVSPWSVLPLCGINKEEAEARNLTLVNTTSTSPGNFENNSPVRRDSRLFNQDESAKADKEDKLSGE